MPALQVKDCPQDIYDSLKLCASAEDRSMSQQTIHILRRFLKAYEQLGSNMSNTDQLIFGQVARGTSYDDTNEQNYAAYESRAKLLNSISSLEPLSIPKGFPSVAGVIREDRDDRMYRIEVSSKADR